MRSIKNNMDTIFDEKNSLIRLAESQYPSSCQYSVIKILGSFFDDGFIKNLNNRVISISSDLRVLDLSMKEIDGGFKKNLSVHLGSKIIKLIYTKCKYESLEVSVNDNPNNNSNLFERFSLMKNKCFRNLFSFVIFDSNKCFIKLDSIHTIVKDSGKKSARLKIKLNENSIEEINKCCNFKRNPFLHEEELFADRLIEVLYGQAS
ncbi:MAG: hypothetical protein QW727_04140 [Candidatus Pacearchaeota archaeon]